MAQEISDDQLFDEILKAEDELRSKDYKPKERSLRVPIKVMENLGYDDFVVVGVDSNPLMNRIRTVQKSLYRPNDFAVGGFHGGIYMFRGIAAKISVPLMFGSVSINPFEMNDLTDMQRRWICFSSEDQENYISVYSDVFDLAGAIGASADYPTPPEEAKKFLMLSSFQLQGAAATVVSAFDVRGAVQSALIGAELALKAALKAKNYDEKKLKSYGHNLKKLGIAVAVEYQNFNEHKVSEIASALPLYVENRYSNIQPSYSETGKIVMDAQYIAGETARALTNCSFAEKLTTT